MDKKIAFIGSGNMGKAIIGGIVKSQLTAASNLHVFDIDSSKSREMAEQFGSTVATSATSAAAVADILFIAVKPNVIPALLPELKAHIQPGCIVISIAAGVTLATLEQGLSAGHKIIRVMPNTPALVNCGMSSITPNANITPAELESVLAIFNSFGEAEVVSEYLIHSVVAVSGSAPAYAFMFIEAMADAAVLGGMPRAQAYKFAAQTLLGSAKMVLETGKHPGELKDMVCSPGGTTIEAVKVLEEQGFRAAVINAMQSCMAKSDAMSKK